MMKKEKQRPSHYKAQELKVNLLRIEACLKVMIEDKRTFKNKSKLSNTLGELLDLDPSIFRKSDSKHREILNQYSSILIPTLKNEIEDPQIEIKALRCEVIEKNQQIRILKKVIAEMPTGQISSSPLKESDNYYFEYETACMLVRDILRKNPNLKFINNELYDEATFSSEPEIVSRRKTTEVYMRWENARTNAGNNFDKLRLEE